MITKRRIIETLNRQLDDKLVVLRTNLETLKEVRNNEDKCTVGDKYETGRAMAQMELEKAQVQLHKTEELKATLLKIDGQNTLQKVAFGSLVETSLGIYFIAIAFGKINLDGRDILCLSPVSPIGRMLAGKKTGDTVQFQGNEIEISNIN